MAWGGAKGETAAQMKQVLRFEGSPAELMKASGRLAAALQDPARPVVFRIANRLFGEKTFSLDAAYLEATREAFGGALEPVDFKGAPEAARLLINGWVEGKTEKRIRDLVPQNAVDRDTRLVLVNAIYFLGDWQEPFTKEATRPAPFSLSAAQKKDVPPCTNTAPSASRGRTALRPSSFPKREQLFDARVLPTGCGRPAALEDSRIRPGLERPRQVPVRPRT